MASKSGGAQLLQKATLSCPRISRYVSMACVSKSKNLCSGESRISLRSSCSIPPAVATPANESRATPCPCAADRDTWGQKSRLSSSVVAFDFSRSGVVLDPMTLTAVLPMPFNVDFIDSRYRCRSGIGSTRNSRNISASSCRTDNNSLGLGTNTESSSGVRDFVWRTTERRFIDFCLSPEEERRLRALHDKITANPWSSISKKEVAACLRTTEERDDPKNKSLLGRLLRTGSYFLSPRGLEEDGRRLFRTLIPLYENTASTEKYFGIGESNFNGRIYFLLLHLWSLHCSLQQSGAETLKIKLWDALWDFLTNILLQEGVSEFKVPSVLREQQFVSLGFCVALDEAFEDESSGPAGQLAHRLWVTIFDAAEDKRECPELIALTTYAMRTRSFALELTRDSLVQGTFKWPGWPPSEMYQSASEGEAYSR